MANKKELTLTCEEGQAILRIASSFGMPEKLGAMNYTVADRALAADEVMKLYRELRSYSPMLQKTERWLLFGPASNYEEIKNDGGKPGHKMVDSQVSVKISLDDDSESGLIWVLVMCLHPASPVCQGISVQSDVVWPLVAKLKRSKAIRKTIGLDEAKPTRWKSDDDVEEKVAAEEEAKK